MKSLRACLENIFTVHQQSCWKVMFLYLFVCPWVGGYDVTSYLVPCSVQGSASREGACLKGRIHQKAITEGHFQTEGHTRRLFYTGGGLHSWKSNLLVLPSG